MKKRGRQFFALWLALMLSAVSVPQAVQLQAAGSVKLPIRNTGSPISPRQRTPV